MGNLRTNSSGGGVLLENEDLKSRLYTLNSRAYAELYSYFYNKSTSSPGLNKALLEPHGEFTNYFEISGDNISAKYGNGSSKIATCIVPCTVYIASGNFNKQYYSASYSYNVISNGEMYRNNDKITLYSNDLVKVTCYVGDTLYVKTYTDRSYEACTDAKAYIA